MPGSYNRMPWELSSEHSQDSVTEVPDAGHAGPERCDGQAGDVLVRVTSGGKPAESYHSDDLFRLSTVHG
jgi:hypothetical protein